HIGQLRLYLDECGGGSTLVTSVSWGGPLVYPVFGLRKLLLERCSRPASVAWYLHWHEVFLRNALRRHLAGMGDCVVYAQDAPAARAPMRVRRGPHQRAGMAAPLGIARAAACADTGPITWGRPGLRRVRAREE